MLRNSFGSISNSATFKRLFIVVVSGAVDSYQSLWLNLVICLAQWQLINCLSHALHANWRKTLFTSSKAILSQGSSDNLSKRLLISTRQHVSLPRKESSKTMRNEEKLQLNLTSQHSWRLRETWHVSGLDGKSSLTHHHCPTSMLAIEWKSPQMQLKLNDLCKDFLFNQVPVIWRSGAIDKSLLISLRNFTYKIAFSASLIVFSFLSPNKCWSRCDVHCFPPDRLCMSLIAWLSRSFRAIEDGGVEKSISEVVEHDFESNVSTNSSFCVDGTWEYHFRGFDWCEKGELQS